jgi:predicted Zn-dependent peptidase
VEERDNKRKYALKQLEKYMFKNTGYGINLLGNPESINNISGEELFAHYEYMLKNSNIVVEAVGNLCGHENLANDIYNHIIQKIDNNPSFECERIVDLSNASHEPKINKEIQDINQSVLTIGCSLGDIPKEDSYKAMVYAQVLGGSPASKLFQNVREKESLAYFAKAMYNRQKEAIYLFSGIAPQNYDKAKKVMLNQLEEIKNGNVTDIELNAAKQNIIFAYNDAIDSKYEYAKIILANEMYFKNQVEIDEIIEKIRSVTLSDVVGFANKVKVEQIFLLGGIGNE